ncbi:MAG: ADP-ribosylglycohydrolase family protein [Anaerolineae bacterium]
MSEQQRARSFIYGLALGDALGYPIEFLKMDKITTIYGPQGITEPPNPALYSDDTQTSIVVAESLIEQGEHDTEAVMDSFTKHFIGWANSPDNARHPGHTVTEAARTLSAGISWRESGADRMGNGSAIRVAPIGYFYQHAPDRLRDVAAAVGMATHNNPTAIAATVGAAYCVKLALDGAPPEQYVNLLLQAVGEMDETFSDTLRNFGHVLAWTDEVNAVKHIGAGWGAHEAVAMSVYCAMRHPDDYAAAVQRAVNTEGDSDSVGCITGSIVGARVGVPGIPQDWIARLENLKEITDLADRLAAKKAKV